MTLRVSGKNMDVGDALRGKAEDHFSAVVGKYFDGGYDGHLTLTPDGIGFRADCVVHLDSGATLQASAQGGDANSAYEVMALNIEKRLRRRRNAQDPLPVRLCLGQRHTMALAFAWRLKGGRQIAVGPGCRRCPWQDRSNPTQPPPEGGGAASLMGLA